MSDQVDEEKKVTITMWCTESEAKEIRVAAAKAGSGRVPSWARDYILSKLREEGNGEQPPK